MTNKNIHICDDWLTTKIPDLELIQFLSEKMRSEGTWTEVVGGMKSIAVQFDPAKLTPSKAAALLQKQCAAVPSTSTREFTEIQIPVCYHSDFALDSGWIAERLQIEEDDIPEWHSGLSFTVTMLGFMPGFGYLQTDSDIPEFGRLPKPRQNVAAGSIGIIGDQSCIYSFSSPGGWPIIGRTSTTLFNANNRDPSLLFPGQTVRFLPITISEFEDLHCL